MTTKEEFSKAIQLVINCRATVKCGCEYDEQQADWLYYQCKMFAKEYKEIYEKEFKKGV